MPSVPQWVHWVKVIVIRMAQTTLISNASSAVASPYGFAGALLIFATLVIARLATTSMLFVKDLGSVSSAY